MGIFFCVWCGGGGWGWWGGGEASMVFQEWWDYIFEVHSFFDSLLFEDI